MNLRRNNSVTLMEVMVVSVLLGLLMFAFSSMDLFSRFQVISSDRRAKLQNEASYVIEHITKNVTGTEDRGGAIGDITSSARYPVTVTTIGSDNAILIWIDSDKNARLDTTSDIQVAYQYKPAPLYEIWYYSDYTNSPSSYEVLTIKNSATGYSVIRPDFSTNTSQPTYVTYSASNNYLEVQITSCWDPAEASYSCGTPDNPSFTVHNRMRMPSVSTN